MLVSKSKLDLFSNVLGALVLVMGSVTFLYWFTGEGLFYKPTSPVMSPFTSFSLVLMMTAKMASKHSRTWTRPMTLALLGIVACGNFSSLWIQLASPELFLLSMPRVVPTSVMTSLGLITFCFYDILVAIRRTPNTAFIFDDILLHLALFPGGLSLLGHVLDVPVYTGAGLDPRVGIAPMEMAFMGAYAIVAAVSNPDLFLWRFLATSALNRIVFAVLFLNQYFAPMVVGLVIRGGEPPSRNFGIEFYVMLSGVLATLIFLAANAISLRGRKGPA